MAAVYRTGAAQGELLQVWVAPAQRGSGVAEGLMDAILAWAVRAGMTTVDAEVRSDNLRALAFYRRLGFTDVNATDGTVRLQWVARK